ncbi:FadR/GntR family transcriptional regulator [Mesorhizobium australicum]|uniref:Transcriptional regulator, GntR family n=1 Tax=Mesorhizobium australicum TaxID=536018 RepID=A0A1X7N106_9HYPH|nr:FadR/GntR family transcriptional regulator [Mesorhizobium australicum]SMH30882.1 transcriptional regulator, GntR family [Mesorhizobium australicum]
MTSEYQIDRVVVPKASGLLATRLRDLIIQGEFASGDLLPPERDLVAESGLSRGSVREALKILETEGLIEIRAGRSGGARVTVPKRTDLARSTELFVRTNGVSLEALLDCRIAVEPMLAKLTARNRTEQELDILRDLHRKFEASTDDIQRYRRVNFQWHLAVASMSRNEPLTALMEAISTPVYEATGYEVVTTPETRRAAVMAHAEVMAAIERQDEAAAARGMEKHLTAYSSILRSSE